VYLISVSPLLAQEGLLTWKNNIKLVSFREEKKIVYFQKPATLAQISAQCKENEYFDPVPFWSRQTTLEPIVCSIG
jgi:hypothetical protein